MTFAVIVSGRVEVLLGFPSLQDRPAGRSVVPVLLPVVSGGLGLSQSETKTVDSCDHSRRKRPLSRVVFLKKS